MELWSDPRLQHFIKMESSIVPIHMHIGHQMLWIESKSKTLILAYEMYRGCARYHASIVEPRKKPRYLSLIMQDHSIIDINNFYEVYEKILIVLLHEKYGHKLERIRK